MTSFDFSQEEAWAGGAYLGVGNHLCKISDAKSGSSKNGHPQIELRVTNGIGDSSRDWIVVTPNTLGKVLQLANSAGHTNPGSIDIPSEDWDNWVAGLNGKSVGAIVREEPKGYGDNPEQVVAKIQSYVHPSELGNASSDVPGDTSDLVQSAQVQDDDIPF